MASRNGIYSALVYEKGKFGASTLAPLPKTWVWTQVRELKRKSLMHDSDWLKLNSRLIFLICVQTQILCNGAIVSQNVP